MRGVGTSYGKIAVCGFKTDVLRCSRANYQCVRATMDDSGIGCGVERSQAGKIVFFVEESDILAGQRGLACGNLATLCNVVAFAGCLQREGACGQFGDI